mgnify:CR=1 FL=1
MQLRGMVSTLERRGPDGVATILLGPFAVGHTRLAIIDLVTGDQPVFNESRSIACVLNGEIYNYAELRRELIDRGHSFATRSDTEVIVHLYEELGEGVFDRLVGMFAIAIADLHRRRLVVGRDRVGEKPLYYLDNPGLFCCASEVKALLQHPASSADIDRVALSQFLRHGYVPGPRSIYESFRRLSPGHYAVVEEAGTTVKRYWEIRLRPGPARRRQQEELLEQLRAKLASAVNSQLVADVPVGIFLSGGLDSSAVLASAARSAQEPMRTFAVGFGTDISELPYARQVAQRFGTVHTELNVSPRTDDLEAVLRYLDEPFTNNSSFPTNLLSRAAMD